MATPVPPADWPAQRRAIVGDALAVAFAVGTYGTGFGAVSVAAGLSVLQTCLLSLVMFTGASQFAFVGVVAAGGAPVSGMLTALLLGTRNTLYGLRLASVLQVRGWRRLGAAHLVIDESTAMSVMRESPPAARTGFWATGLGVFAFWNLFTLLGAVAGSALGDPRAWGLDAAVGAAFLALLWPRLADVRNRWVGVGGAAVALALVPFVPAGVPVIAAGGVALLAAVLTRGEDPTEYPSPEDLP